MKQKEKKEQLLSLLREEVAIPKIAGLLKISEEAVWKRVKRLERAGEVQRISKSPAFFKVLVPPSESEPFMHSERLSIDKHRKGLVHKAHRLKFSIDFKGAQPFRGAAIIKPFGRYKTAKQAIFKLGNITITAFKRKLNVWVHNPPGQLTQHQIINAREKAYLTLLNFAKEHQIALEGDLSQVLRSHHVVEHETVNEGLKPVFEAHPKELEERIGSKICKTSHKGKIEHEGVSSELTGAIVARNAEYLFTRFPSDFSLVAQSLSGFGEYNRNIQLHLGVLRKMSDTLDKIQEKL